MNSRRIQLLILAADLLWNLFALTASLLLRNHGDLRYGISQSAQGSFQVILAVSCAFWICLYLVRGLDCFRGGWQSSAMISKITMAVMFQMVAIVIWGYGTRLYYSRLVLLYFGVLLWAGVILIRFAAYGILRAQARAGKTRKVMLFGENSLSREVLYHIRRHPELRYDVVGSLSPLGGAELPNGNDAVGGPAGLGSLDALKLLAELRVQIVIVATKHAPKMEVQNFLVRCQEAGIQIHLLPQPYELYISRPKLIEIDGVPLLCLEQPSFSLVAKATKRSLDLVLGSVLLFPAIVVLAVCGGALWLRERRFLRTETRCGRHGRPFGMYRLDIETEEGRATEFHKLLRRLSVSELPQLFNVLRGQMSLVGPRPESPERVRGYSDWQKQRLKVTPGMTGLAQVNGLREQHPSEEKTRHDLQYVLHWTPVLDLVLLLQTIWTLAARLMAHQEKAAPLSAKSSLSSRHEVSQPIVPSIGE